MSHDTSQPPTAYVIAGPNGAGKTTFASEFLPDFVDCREFLNADLIAAGLSPFAPESQNVLAGRLLLQRMKQLTHDRRGFGIETTLAGRSYFQLFGEMKRIGYRLDVFFLWLPSADLAVSRVTNRVRQGGHNVPEMDIRRRFDSGLRNFFKLYRPLIDEWWIYDASRLPPSIVASEKFGQLTCWMMPCSMSFRNMFRSEDMADETKKTSSLADKANAAFRQVASKVVQRAKQTGTPVIVWERGHIREVLPDEIAEMPNPGEKVPIK